MLTRMLRQKGKHAISMSAAGRRSAGARFARHRAGRPKAGDSVASEASPPLSGHGGLLRREKIPNAETSVETSADC